MIMMLIVIFKYHNQQILEQYKNLDNRFFNRTKKTEKVRIDSSGWIVNGLTNIHNGNAYAVPNDYVAAGSLAIRGTNTNYGGGIINALWRFWK